MPSAELLKQKEQFVKELSEKLKNSAAGVLVDYKGITVADDTKLRKEFREALAICESDPVAPAKVAAKYADALKNCFTIKVGFMDGDVLDANKVIEVGKLPSKDQLVAQLLSVLTGNIRGMAVALNKIAEQKESA